MNRVDLVGRLTNKPELRYTNSNIAYCNFTLAINRAKKEDGTQETDFIDCLVWRTQAENLCKYQDKGNLISVEGTLRKESYSDKEGNKKYITRVLTNQIRYLSSKNVQKNENIVQNSTEIIENEDPFADFGEQISIDDNFLD